MKPARIKCPSCGAEHDVSNPGIITIVCEYCGTAIYWDEKKIKDAGKQSILPEGFSRLYRGATESAGELGHTHVVENGAVCRCGSFGCHNRRR